MSVTVLRFLLVLGIIGHAVNMYCDRIISIFPNGRLKIEDIKTIGEEGKMEKLMEYVFLHMGKDARAKDMMVSLYNSETATTKCYIGYLVYIFALIIAIVTGTAAVPVWAVIFTVLPIFIAMFPFRIIGTLHIAAMVTMLAWIFLV